MCKFVRNNPQLYTKREDNIKTKFTLRHKNRLNLPSSNLKIHSTSTLVMSIKIYNNLPERIKNEEKYTTFINKLKNFLILKCYYTVKEYLSERFK